MPLISKIDQKTHGAVKVPWVTLGIAVMTLLVYAFSDVVFLSWVVDKTAIAQGEWGRIFLGHFVHFNFDHLFWDVVALVIFGGVIECQNPRDVIPSFVFSCGMVSAWFIGVDTQWQRYCGLSGALNGLLVVAALSLYRRIQNPMYLVVIGLTLAKTMYEFLTQQTLFTDIGSQAVPGAHAAGLLAGFLYCGWQNIRDKVLFSCRKGFYNVLIWRNNESKY